MTPEFAELIKSEFAKYPRGYWFNIPKGTLVKLSDEEKKFIEKRVLKYKQRGKDVLSPSPGSFWHFLTDEGYKEDDTVEIWIESINELVDAGYVDIVEGDGFHYWALANGEVLDPKEYRDLYKVDRRTFRTLMKELGYLDIYEAFKDSIEPSRFIAVAEFKRNGVEFELYDDKLMASASLLVGNSELYVVMTVKRPTLSDVYKVFKRINNKISDKFSAEVKMLKDYILRETGVDIPEEGFRGYVKFKGSRITAFRVFAYGSVERGRKIVRLNLRWEKVKKRLSVRLEGTIMSNQVNEVFCSINPKDLDAEIPPGYTLKRMWGSGRVSLIYRSSFKGLPSISEHYERVSNVGKVLSELLRKYLKKIQDEEIVIYKKRSTGMKVKDFLEILDWDPSTSFDEVILKLIAAEAELGEAHMPRIYGALKVQAILEGHSQDELIAKVNNALETVMEYMSEGRLGIRYIDTPEGARAPRVYLGNKRLDVRVEHLPNFEKLLIIAKTLLHAS